MSSTNNPPQDQDTTRLLRESDLRRSSRDGRRSDRLRFPSIDPVLPDLRNAATPTLRGLNRFVGPPTPRASAVAVPPAPTININIIKEEENDDNDDRKPPAAVTFAHDNEVNKAATFVFKPIIAKDSSITVTSTTINKNNKENNDNNKLPASTVSDEANIIANKSTVEIFSAATTPTNNDSKESGNNRKFAATFIKEESTATFKPVIQLEEVEVKSGEEEEEVLCSYRSKLFLFGETLLDKGTGKKTWMERGVGNARILRHRGNGRLRFLMRREETKKVIANHALDPRIKLESNAGSGRSWVWSCSDFSDGESEEKLFALKFKDSKLAEEFKAKFEECQAEMAQLLAGEDAPSTQQGGGGGGEDEDYLATALGGLSTKDDG